LLDTVQQLGLVIVNLSIGWANDYWLLLSVLCAFAFWRAETGPDAHGLEAVTTQNFTT
jgi:hypothetical protein